MSSSLLLLERRLYEAKKILPPEEFRESLKAFLYSRIGEQNETWFGNIAHRVEEREEFSDMKERIWQKLTAGIQHTSRNTLGNIVSLFLRPFFWKTFTLLCITAGAFVLFLRFLLGVPVNDVSIQANLVPINGEVSILHDGVQSRLQEGMKVAAGDVISVPTESSAEIRFFTDAYIYLFPDTRIRIESQAPNPTFPDSGEILLSLEKGGLWVRSFTEPTIDTSLVIRSNDVLVSPYAGAASIVQNGSETVVQVYDRSVRVIDRKNQRSSMFIAGDRIQFSVLTGMTTTAIDPSQIITSALQQAQRADKAYIATRQQTTLEAAENTIGVLPGSSLYPAKVFFEKIFLLRSQSSEQYFANIQKRFQEALLLANERKGALAQSTLQSGVETLQLFLEASPQFEPFARQLFIQMKKDLVPLSPDSHLRPIRSLVLAAQTQTFPASAVFAEQQQIEMLWELLEFVNNNTLIPREHFETYAAQKLHAPNFIAETSQAKQTLLRMKIQELRLLDFLFTNLFAERDIERSEAKIIEQVLALITGEADVTNFLWDAQEFPKEENPIDLFREKVAIYTTEQGQRNQTIRLLQEVPNDFEQLPFLQELRTELPDILRTDILQKMIFIIEEEEKKATLEAS